MNNTTALYYEKPYESRFQAKLISSVEREGKWHTELDRTLFYPEGGGQPADGGTLNGIPVLDVRKVEKRIIHLTDTRPEGDEITGVLDWEKRYHFMIQHTGQHLISAALKEAGDINTLSVHMGEKYCSIEVDCSDFPPELSETVEDLSNRRIRENLPVTQTVASNRSELEQYKLRRETKLEEGIRLVSIDQMDTAACGGVHVSRTGELGLIKYTAMEKIRGRLRLFWKIGGPAYRDYREKDHIVSLAASLLSTQTEELTSRIKNLVKEKSDMTKRTRELEAHSAENVARMMSESITHYPPLLIRDIPEGSPEFFKQTVKLMTEDEGLSFLLTMKHDSRLHWALYLPLDRKFNFNLFRENCLSLINGKGGGKGPLWQGSGDHPDQAENFHKAFRDLERI